MPTRSPAGFRPRLEALEDRRLMASQLNATFAGGLLRIDGSSAADRIVLHQSGARISVEGATISVRGVGQRASVAARDIARIHIHGKEGADILGVGGESARGPDGISIPTWIWAGEGNDRIWGSHAADKIHADGGNDTVYGRGGADTLDGDAGNDTLDGSASDDKLRGGAGNDKLHGGVGLDRLEGGDGADELRGGDHDDRLDGGGGRNRHYGEAGNDRIWSRSRQDTVDGGSGRDWAGFTDAAAPRSTRDGLGEIVRRVENYSFPAASAPASAPAAATAAAPFAQEFARLIDLTNRYRASQGLSVLSIDTRLNEAARYQAQLMARTGHYSHVNPDGRNLADRAGAAGYSFAFVAENIHLYDPAIRRTYGIDRIYSRAELADYYLDGWKVSPSHNRNLLAPQVRHIAVAMAQDRGGRIFVAQLFGKP